jgi:hypothetical protein
LKEVREHEDEFMQKLRFLAQVRGRMQLAFYSLGVII